MIDLLTLLGQAHGGGDKTLWDPTILGVLVAISAIVLFCGSVYLLLGTNLGARLGFLVSMACLSGFMVLLSLTWITTATPLNSPRGRIAQWKMVEVVDDLEASTVATVRTIADNGVVLTITDEEDQIAPLRPGVEAGLVRPDPESGGAGSEFAEFDTSTDFLTDFEGFQSFIIGGDTKNVFWHEPQYAAVQFCPKEVVEVSAGEAPPPPACDPLEPARWAIIQYDYGSLRFVPWMYFFVSCALFGLSLLGLHWYETDQREQKRKAADLQPVPTPGA